MKARTALRRCLRSPSGLFAASFVAAWRGVARRGAALLAVAGEQVRGGSR